MRAINLTLMGLLALPGMGWGAGSGTTSANFLKLGIGPRAIAMGDAQVGLADDVFATYWNPAGLAQLEVPQAGLVQNEYVQDITEQYAAYAHPTSIGTFGGSFTHFSVGNFQGFDIVAQPTTQVGASDNCASLSYAAPLYKDRRYGTLLSAGANTKWIHETLDTASASAYAADLGLLFVPGKKWGEFLDGWRGGLSLRNLGTGLKFDTESFPLPRTLTAGLSYSGRWRGESFTLAMDGQQPNDGARTLSAGIELLTLKVLVVRAGYTTSSDLGNGIRAGGGLRFKTFQIDYAYAAMGAFGNVNRLGITFFFGKKPANSLLLAENSYEKGLREYKAHQYDEALKDFNKAAETDPNHPHAMAMIEKIYEKLKETTPE